MAEPPVAPGAVHERLTVPSPAEGSAEGFPGAPGTVRGVTADEGSDATLHPAEFWASTRM